MCGLLTSEAHWHGAEMLDERDTSVTPEGRPRYHGWLVSKIAIVPSQGSTEPRNVKPALEFHP